MKEGELRTSETVCGKFVVKGYLLGVMNYGWKFAQADFLRFLCVPAVIYSNSVSPQRRGGFAATEPEPASFAQ